MTNTRQFARKFSFGEHKVVDISTVQDQQEDFPTLYAFLSKNLEKERLPPKPAFHNRQVLDPALQGEGLEALGTRN